MMNDFLFYLWGKLFIMILYKYYPCNEYTFRSLSRLGLWCGSAINMNDPFDSLLQVDMNFKRHEINSAKSYIKSLSEPKPELKKLLNMDDEKFADVINMSRKRRIQSSSFCSLSENPLDMLMWSHYGNSHKGLVLGVDFHQNDLNYSYFQKVKYVKKLPPFNLISQIDCIQLDELELESNNQLYDAFNLYYKHLSVKYKDWKYEREWRIWGSESTYYPYTISQVQSVYFGLRCEDDTKEVVRSIFNGHKLSCFRYHDIEFDSINGKLNII